ncbi:MAG: hypothetical protein WCP66_08465 [Methylococcales bacterium]
MGKVYLVLVGDGSVLSNDLESAGLLKLKAPIRGELTKINLYFGVDTTRDNIIYHP